MGEEAWSGNEEAYLMKGVTNSDRARWKEIRGIDLDKFIKTDPKGKYCRKLKYVPCFEDCWIQWLTYLQILGVASWKTLTDYLGIHKDGFAENDIRNAMIGGKFIEKVSSEIRRGKKKYPIFAVTERGAETIAFAANFHNNNQYA